MTRPSDAERQVRRRYPEAVVVDYLDDWWVYPMLGADPDEPLGCGETVSEAWADAWDTIQRRVEPEWITEVSREPRNA